MNRAFLFPLLFLSVFLAPRFISWKRHIQTRGRERKRERKWEKQAFHSEALEIEFLSLLVSILEDYFSSLAFFRVGKNSIEKKKGSLFQWSKFELAPFPPSCWHILDINNPFFLPLIWRERRPFVSRPRRNVNVRSATMGRTVWYIFHQGLDFYVMKERERSLLSWGRCCVHNVTLLFLKCRTCMNEGFQLLCDERSALFPVLYVTTKDWGWKRHH